MKARNDGLKVEYENRNTECEKWKEKSIELLLRLDTRMNEVNRLLSADGLAGDILKLLTPAQMEVARASGYRPEMYAVELLKCYQQGRVSVPRSPYRDPA